MGSIFGALAGEEYDKIAPVIACTLPALTDSIPERKREELAGEVTRELQVVGKAASIAIQTWVRNNDKTRARAEEREEEHRMDRAPVHGMEGEPRRTGGVRKTNRRRRHATSNPVVSCHDAPEGDPSANIIAVDRYKCSKREWT